MRVQEEEGLLLEKEMLQQHYQNGMLEDLGMVAGMKSVSVIHIFRLGLKPPFDP
jgi:hypothetical protein